MTIEAGEMWRRTGKVEDGVMMWCLPLRPHGSGRRVSVSSWYRHKNYTRRWTITDKHYQAVAYHTRAQAAQAVYEVGRSAE